MDRARNKRRAQSLQRDATPDTHDETRWGRSYPTSDGKRTILTTRRPTRRSYETTDETRETRNAPTSRRAKRRNRTGRKTATPRRADGRDENAAARGNERLHLPPRRENELGKTAHRPTNRHDETRNETIQPATPHGTPDETRNGKRGESERQFNARGHDEKRERRSRQKRKRERRGNAE